MDAHVAAETAVRRHEMGGIADEEGAPLRQKHRGQEAYQSAARNGTSIAPVPGSAAAIMGTYSSRRLTSVSET